MTWKQIQEGTELTRALLEELGLASFLKTSGGKGLHVVVPIAPKEDWDTVKALAKAIVEHMATIIPERFVAKSGAEEPGRPDLRRLPAQRLRRHHRLRLVGPRPPGPRRLGALRAGTSSARSPAAPTGRSATCTSGSRSTSIRGAPMRRRGRR